MNADRNRISFSRLSFEERQLLKSVLAKFKPIPLDCLDGRETLKELDRRDKRSLVRLINRNMFKIDETLKREAKRLVSLHVYVNIYGEANPNPQQPNRIAVLEDALARDSFKMIQLLREASDATRLLSQRGYMLVSDGRRNIVRSR
jgi:hypothetical protein